MASNTDIDIPSNTNHRPSRPSTHLLTLTSYSHRLGPLVPAPTPNLTFDVRALPNPPKRIRDVCVGTDKALRAAFMADERCRQRVQAIVSDIEAVLAGEELDEQAQGDDEGKQKQKEEDEDEDEDGEIEIEYKPPIHVRVGVCCEMGRHRSVACVEELARVAWPPHWEINVVHRDLKKHRSERDKEKRTRRVERLDEDD